MSSKERLYAVIGGCVGAVLTLVVARSPQSERKANRESSGR